MRFSTFQVASSTGSVDDGDVLALTVRQSLAADRQGFSAVFLPEHHVTGYAPFGADPVAFAAYLAPQLTRAWIGFAVTVVPSWHPVRLVERLNLLDHLLEGRLLVGVGSGVSSVEHAALGFRTDDMVAGMTDDVLDVALKLWAKDIGDPEIAFGDGRYYRGNVFTRVVPGPYTAPHPHLARVAARPEAIHRAATEGWPVMVFGGDGRANLLGRLDQYRRELLAAGHDEQTLAFCQDWTTHTVLSVAIGDTEAEARAYAMADMQAYQGFVRTERPHQQRAYELGVTSRAPFPRDVTDPAFVDNNVIYGTADQVEEQLRELEEIGFGNILIAFNYGAYDPSRRHLGEEMQKRFATEVMPRFAATAPSMAALETDLSTHLAKAGASRPAIDHPTQRTGA